MTATSPPGPIGGPGAAGVGLVSAGEATHGNAASPAGHSGCVNCGHDDHYGERCDGDADGDWCACSWPDPSNFTERQPRLSIGHVTWRTSKAFVGQEHRHHPPSQGHMWSTGVFDGDRLCGVAVIGRPVSRMLQEAGQIEVVRLATDGTPNACSALYGAAARQAVAHGWQRWQLLTYILDSEPGTSVRAAGWVLDGTTDGGEWDRPSRTRVAKAPTVPKQRWRAAPAPLPADYACHECGHPIDDIGDAHTCADGHDVHPECCDICRYGGVA